MRPKWTAHPRVRRSSRRQWHRTRGKTLLGFARKGEEAPAKSVAGSPAHRSPKSITPVSCSSRNIRFAGADLRGSTEEPDHGSASSDVRQIASTGSRSIAAPT